MGPTYYQFFTHTSPHSPRGVTRPWWGRCTPAIFLGLVAVLLILLAGHNPLQAALGARIVGLGLPVYLVAFRQRLTQPGDTSA